MISRISCGGEIGPIEPANLAVEARRAQQRAASSVSGWLVAASTIPVCLWKQSHPSGAAFG